MQHPPLYKIGAGDLQHGVAEADKAAGQQKRRAFLEGNDPYGGRRSAPASGREDYRLDFSDHSLKRQALAAAGAATVPVEATAGAAASQENGRGQAGVAEAVAAAADAGPGVLLEELVEAETAKCCPAPELPSSVESGRLNAFPKHSKKSLKRLHPVRPVRFLPHTHTHTPRDRLTRICRRECPRPLA